MSKRKYKEKPTCCVADVWCTAAGNFEDEAKERISAVCYSCGQLVCRNCSSRRNYLSYGKVRLCNDCQVALDGNEKVVMRRLKHLTNGE